jgi:hypothetical protein
MTNEVKDDVLTEEQKKFILDYLNKGMPNYNKIIDPDKISVEHYNNSVYQGAKIEASDNWFQKIGKIYHTTQLAYTNPFKVSQIQKYATNNYSEMSEFEKVAFIKQSLSKYKQNRAVSAALESSDVKEATDIKTLEKALQNVLRNKDLQNHQSFTTKQLQSAGSSALSPEVEIFNAQSIINGELGIAKAFNDYPATPKPEPEPVVEKPNWFETTSKDHQVRIEQWMEHLGMKDQAKALIDKYGLPVAYEVVQTAMQSPADMIKATDGKFKNSKDTIKYFLDNDVTAEKLETIPDLDAETIKASLDSVKKPEPIVRPEPLPTISIGLPGATVSKPKLSEADMKKVHYAALMRDTLKLDGIDEAEIKAATDVAFKANLDNTYVNMESWTGAFKYNLVTALGLEEIAKDKSVYRNWASAIDDCSKRALETSASSKTSEELKGQVEIYTTEVNKKTLKSDLAGMSGTETLNPETYFKDRQVQKKLEAREAKKAEREAKKAERTENRQERRDNLKEWFNNSFKSVTD